MKQAAILLGDRARPPRRDGAEGRPARPPLPARRRQCRRLRCRTGRWRGSGAFSAIRRPHPVDSAAGDAVRERLIAEMRSVGLEPRDHRRFRLQRPARRSAIACARVRNLVATIGPAQGRHLLLVSHYDSTPTGPGAADDGIGVASMLEVAHLLRGQRLNRPVTFLFNEGEEAGPARRPRLPGSRSAGSAGRYRGEPRIPRRRRARRSCSRPAVRTALRSRSTAPRSRARSPIRSRPISTA